MKTSTRRTWRELLTTTPSFLWLTVFFLLPTLIIFAIAFKPSVFNMTIPDGWTLKTITGIRSPNLPEVIFRTTWLGLATTFASVAISIPVAYYIARCTPQKKNLVLFLTIIPFWTCFLIRIFAWKEVLHPDGLLKRLLVFCHLSEPGTPLYGTLTVLVVMIYTELPFAILPLYSAAEKFDFTLMEAAMDLGAGRFRAFVNVFIPGIKSGILSACLMVLIPSFGSYVVPDVVGNTNSSMIGNLIASKVFSSKNLPEASAMSAVLIVTMLFFMLLPTLYRLLCKAYRHFRSLHANEGGL